MKIWSHDDVRSGVAKLAQDIRLAGIGKALVYPVPRGGVPVAYALQYSDPVRFALVERPEGADLFVDDLIDSGATRDRYMAKYPGIPFFAMYEKEQGDGWQVFPWEQGEAGQDGGEDIVTRLLQYVGEDPKREGLLETPARVLKAWRHWAGGYGKNPADVLKTFEDGAEGVDEMVVVKDLPFYSQCEHHLATFFGTATIAYIPNRKIVGLSKISRLLDIYARRLQVQERLTNQVADALRDGLDPIGVGVQIKARHLCMESRGICQQGHYTITSAVRGAIADDAKARAEFLGFCS